MAIITYKNKKYQYKAEDLRVENLCELSKEDAKELLFRMQDVLEECGLKMYLTYGTLLGAIREKDFIKGDVDVDVYVDDEDKLFDNLGYIEQRGLHLSRVIPRTVYTFRMNQKCFIDIYIVKKHFVSLWSFYCYKHSTCYIPKSLFSGEKKIPFLGGSFWCVENPQELLRFWYGDSWNVPISKDVVMKYYYTVKSHYFYMKFVTSIKNVIKRILGERIVRKISKMKAQ